MQPEQVLDQLLTTIGHGESGPEPLSNRSAAELAAAGEDTDQARLRQETVWQTRIEDFLEELAHEDREEAATALRAVLTETAGAVSAGNGGAAAGRDVNVRADRGSFAAWNADTTAPRSSSSSGSVSAFVASCSTRVRRGSAT